MLRHWHIYLLVAGLMLSGPALGNDSHNSQSLDRLAAANLSLPNLLNEDGLAYGLTLDLDLDGNSLLA